jgi:DNA-binding HxlR family transcriptional regulator
MRWSEIDTVPCPVAQAMSVIGDTWTILILRDALRGASKFEEFQRATGASRAIVADRLAHLVEYRVFERVQYEAHPPRYEYRLTKRGRDLQPVLMMLAHWSENHLGKSPGGKPLRIAGRRHTTCGHTFTPVVTCSHCGEAATPDTITYDTPRHEIVKR